MPVYRTDVSLESPESLLVRVSTSYNWSTEHLRLLQKVATTGCESLSALELKSPELVALLHYRFITQRPDLTDLGKQVLRQLGGAP